MLWLFVVVFSIPSLDQEALQLELYNLMGSALVDAVNDANEHCQKEMASLTCLRPSVVNGVLKCENEGYVEFSKECTDYLNLKMESMAAKAKTDQQFEQAAPAATQQCKNTKRGFVSFFKKSQNAGELEKVKGAQVINEVKERSFARKLKESLKQRWVSCLYGCAVVVPAKMMVLLLRLFGLGLRITGLPFVIITSIVTLNGALGEHFVDYCYFQVEYYSGLAWLISKAEKYALIKESKKGTFTLDGGPDDNENIRNYLAEKTMPDHGRRYHLGYDNYLHRNRQRKDIAIVGMDEAIKFE